MRPAALVAAAGLFCGAPAFATLDTGKTLWDSCNDPDTSKQSYCLGYVAGVSDILVGMHIIPVRAHFFNVRRFTMKYSRSGTGVGMSENTIERGAAEVALAFGSTVRRRRKALNMRQDELALATGVGRRFLIDLEAGKPTCQLGRSLLVANVLGLRVTDLLASESLSLCAPKAGQELPDFPDVVEEPDGQSTGIL